jgi:hypothetical protein
MSLGEFVLGDVKDGYKLEPTYIVIQVPFEVRADFARLKEMPVGSQFGGSVPLGELGDFFQVEQDPIIYHKDLRPVEFVTAETQGRLGAPIYGMFDVIDALEDYTTPDGIELKGTWTAPPDSDAVSSFEWAGEWTVTYETFRDMGMAFGAAIILIYMLVVMEFGNFSLPAVIMAPIPLTLVGIIPGHWILGAEFTATSMIGFIALAGIIVRNSILLVDFTKHEIAAGRPVTDSVLLACKARTRPIVVTALALVGGSVVIIFDPIFKGMAISLAFGVMVSTVLTLVVIPLGAISVRKAFAEKSLDSSGAAVYAELPYDPILAGEYRDEDDDDHKGLIDYIAIALGFIWIFVVSMALALWYFSRDMVKSVIRLLTRSLATAKKAVPVAPQKEEAPPATTVAVDTEANGSAMDQDSSESTHSAENKQTEYADTDEAADSEITEPESNAAASEPEQESQVETPSVTLDEEPQSEAIATAEGTADDTSKEPATVKKATAKKKIVKKASSKKTSTKKASAKKPAAKKKAVAKKTAKSPQRRGIRLKNDIDEDNE